MALRHGITHATTMVTKGEEEPVASEFRCSTLSRESVPKSSSWMSFVQQQRYKGTGTTSPPVCPGTMVGLKT